VDRRRQVVGLLGILGVTFLVPGLGSLFTDPAWYGTLARPAWAPPAWVFGPVWTVLYGLMAVAAWLVWRERGLAGARGALGLYAVQLALNAAWTPIFFGLRLPGLALLELGVLWVAIVATTVAFWRIRRVAAVLLLPYLAWVSFAAALNAAIVRMN
jgi:translocator protein